MFLVMCRVMLRASACITPVTAKIERVWGRRRIGDVLRSRRELRRPEVFEASSRPATQFKKGP
jgi:hypothetical protein